MHLYLYHTFMDMASVWVTAAALTEVCAVRVLHVITCRVPRNEDLFYGNMAPGIPLDLPDRDPINETREGFCLCNGSNWCGRKAVSDTTADPLEPQRNIMLGVPRTPTSRRRRRRQTLEPGDDDTSTGNPRTYYTDYEYESVIIIIIIIPPTTPEEDV